MKAGEFSNGSGARKRTLSAATAQYAPIKPFSSCMLRCDHVLLMVQQIFDVRASTMISTSGMKDVEMVLALMVMQSRPFLESQWDCPDLPGLKSLVRIRLNTKASYLMTDNQKSPLTENSTGDELCRFCRYCIRRQPNARCRYSKCSGTTRQLP